MSENQSPKSTPPEQFSDILIKLLITGSGGSTLYFLFREQIPSALIALLVTGGATLLTSFGKGLMAPLKKVSNKWGTKAGTVAATRADSTLENWSGIDAKYLKALQAYCYALEVEGFKADLPPLELKAIFVPIRLDSDPNNPTDADSIKRIWDLLPRDRQLVNERYRRLAIIAAPGYGKTTLTRYLTLNYADQAHKQFGAADRLPILLLFRAMHQQIQNEQTPSLPELILSQVSKLPRCQDLKVSAQWFKQRLDQGKCLVMFDGLDEVPNARREQVSKWVNWQMQAYPSQFILTSRPHGYDSTLFQGIARVGILDFTIKDKEAFISKWYRAMLWHKKWETLWQRSQRQPDGQRLLEAQVRAQCEDEAAKAASELMSQIVRTPALNDLAKNPLLVTIIAATYEAFEYLPDKRVKLYKKMFDLLLENRPYRRETRLTIAATEESQPVLQQLAFKLTETGQEKFTPKQGSEWIADRLAQVELSEPIKPKDFLKEIQTVAGLLAGEEGDLYEFTHKTFQEYLTALEICEQYSTDYLLQQLDNSDWREVISFYAAMTEATPFVLAILDNPTPETLKFAHRVVIEERSKTQSSARERLENQLAKVDLGDQTNARVILEQRFRKPMLQYEKIFISAPITWAEYYLFLEDQQSGQFHSQAVVPSVRPEHPSNQTVKGIAVVDAQWFCGWLSTQTDLVPDQGTYHYRLPTVDEWRQVLGRTISGEVGETLQSSFAQPNNPLNHTLCIAREQIHPHYGSLINYLANTQWQEANKETDQVMLEVADRKAKGMLSKDSIKTFPCEDLQLIDHLWLKFSGGHFGFSVQKDIYLRCGGKADYQYHEKAFQKFGVKVEWHNSNLGWRAGMRYDLAQSPVGHLPRINGESILIPYPKGLYDGTWGVVMSFLLSHPDL